MLTMIITLVSVSDILQIDVYRCNGYDYDNETIEEEEGYDAPVEITSSVEAPKRRESHTVVRVHWAWRVKLRAVESYN